MSLWLSILANSPNPTWSCLELFCFLLRNLERSRTSLQVSPKFMTFDLFIIPNSKFNSKTIIQLGQACLWRRHRRIGHPLRGMLQGQHTHHAVAEGQPDTLDYWQSKRWGCRRTRRVNSFLTPSLSLRALSRGTKSQPFYAQNESDVPPRPDSLHQLFITTCVPQFMITVNIDERRWRGTSQARRPQLSAQINKRNVNKTQIL